MSRQPSTRRSSQHRLTRRTLLTALTTSPLIATGRTHRSAAAGMRSQGADGTPAAAASPGATPGAARTTAPQLYVTPTEVRFDERFDVGVGGLDPSQEVTITSTFADYSTPWTAEATITADTWGFADLARREPVSGTWDVPDTMGLIWSARGSLQYFPAINRTEHIHISAIVDGDVVGEEVVERAILPLDRVATHINNAGMVADYYGPVSGATALVPAVIVLGGSDGGIAPYTRLLAAMLSAHGYATLALGYFGIGALPSQLSEIPLEYFGTAIAWLQGQPDVDPERIGMVGVSRGGELALLLGSRYPEVKAVVSYVGSGYVHAEWTGSSSDPTVAAWTWRGEPVLHLMSAVTTEAELRAVEIPVERINGPVLLIGADDDAVWGSSYLSGIAWDRLQREGHAWPDQLLRYPGAGHGISMPPYMPVNWLATSPFGGDTRSNAIAMAKAWSAVTQMLNARLKY